MRRLKIVLRPTHTDIVALPGCLGEMVDLPAQPSGGTFTHLFSLFNTHRTSYTVYTSVAELHRAATFDVRYELGSVKVQVELRKCDNILDLEIT